MRKLVLRRFRRNFQNLRWITMLAVSPDVDLDKEEGSAPFFVWPRTTKPVTSTNNPMVKLVYCITKKPGMTDEEFSRYWKDVHGLIGARIPGIRRLVQSHRRTVPGDKHKPDYDGMAELWFDDAKSLLATRQSPEWKASSEDEANFIDHSKVAYFVSEEHVIMDE